MDENRWITERFDENRAHLRAVAYRILGSDTEADDAVQDAWLKVLRSSADGVENPRSWLTTIVARTCLDMLRSREAKREEPLELDADATEDGDPGADYALAEVIGPALLVVLQTLTPSERVAFVLHDVFAFTFEEISPIIDRTPVAARQLASRARRRVRGAAVPPADLARHQELVSAFLAASRDGDFNRLLSVLAPDVVLRADARAVRAAAANKLRGAPDLAPEVRGASRVAEIFKGHATGALRARIDGKPGAVWAMGGKVLSAFVFTFGRDAIAAVEIVMAPERLGRLDVKIEGQNV